MKYWREFLYLLCIWNAQCCTGDETKSINNASLETQLEQMKLQMEIHHETQLRQQEGLFGNLEKKINELSSKIYGIQEKLFNTIKSNTESLKDLIRTESQSQVPVIKSTVNDIILSMIDSKEKLEQHEQLLNTIIRNQNDTRQLIKEDMEDHTQALKNIISENLVPLQKINENLKATEDTSMPKIDELKFYQDIQHHLNATELYLKDGNYSLNATNQSYPTSCADFNVNYCTINKCLIKNHLYGPAPFLVACSYIEDGGGWTVIQRRINGSVDFYRNWAEYKDGFGDIDGEFFIGLDKLHALTSTLKPVELRIQLQDFDKGIYYANYDDFQVGNETENYKLIKIGISSNSYGDSLRQHVGYSFTTKDRDNDGNPYGNCAEAFTGAWWYHNCYDSNLNGKYYEHPTKFYYASIDNTGINWNSVYDRQYSLKSVQMLIRPRKL